MKLSLLQHFVFWLGLSIGLVWRLRWWILTCLVVWLFIIANQ